MTLTKPLPALTTGLPRPKPRGRSTVVFVIDELAFAEEPAALSREQCDVIRQVIPVRGGGAELAPADDFSDALAVQGAIAERAGTGS